MIEIIISVNDENDGRPHMQRARDKNDYLVHYQNMKELHIYTPT